MAQMLSYATPKRLRETLKAAGMVRDRLDRAFGLVMQAVEAYLRDAACRRGPMVTNAYLSPLLRSGAWVVLPAGDVRAAIQEALGEDSALSLPPRHRALLALVHTAYLGVHPGAPVAFEYPARRTFKAAR